VKSASGGEIIGELWNKLSSGEKEKLREEIYAKNQNFVR
jgi:hypothetical protein